MNNFSLRRSGAGLPNAIALLLTCAAIGIAEPAAARTMYVSDELVITFRTQPSTRGDILKNLTSGRQVEVLEEPKNSEWSRVRLQDGAEGWVRKQYLMSQPVARDQLSAARREVESLTGTVSQLREQLGSEQSERTESEQTNDSLMAQVGQLEQELAEVRRISGSAMETAEENQRLNQLNARLRDELDQLIAERDNLEDNTQQRWLMIGGGLVLVGLLLGVMIKARPRRSAWT